MPGLRLLAAARAREERLDARDQLERMERLDDVVVGTRAQATDPLLHVGLGGEHDDRDVLARLLCGTDLLRRRVAVELRHGDVHQDQVGIHARHHLDPGRTVGRDVHLVPLLLEGEDEDALDVQVVVDDQDLGGSHVRTLGTWRGELGADYTGCRCGAPMHQRSRSLAQVTLQEVEHAAPIRLRRHGIRLGVAAPSTTISSFGSPAAS